MDLHLPEFLILVVENLDKVDISLKGEKMIEVVSLIVQILILILVGAVFCSTLVILLIQWKLINRAYNLGYERGFEQGQENVFSQMN